MRGNQATYVYSLCSEEEGMLNKKPEAFSVRQLGLSHETLVTLPRAGFPNTPVRRATTPCKLEPGSKSGTDERIGMAAALPPFTPCATSSFNKRRATYVDRDNPQCPQRPICILVSTISM
jgi:hypothetical protein